MLTFQNKSFIFHAKLNSFVNIFHKYGVIQNTKIIHSLFTKKIHLEFLKTLELNQFLNNTLRWPKH